MTRLFSMSKAIAVAMVLALTACNQKEPSKPEVVRRCWVEGAGSDKRFFKLVGSVGIDHPTNGIAWVRLGCDP